MKWTIVDSAKPKSKEFQLFPVIDHFGFREYDARWRYGEQINLLGLQCLGSALATQLWETEQDAPAVIVGHDYREYSMAVKEALTAGLLAAGARVHDIGLGITPMSYFARSHLEIGGLAFVTASHNENPWTGVKVGVRSPLTFGPDDMKRLKEISMGGQYKSGHGSYVYEPGVRDAYIESLIHLASLKRKIRVVASTGNGTCGLFAPRVLSGIGCDVIEQDTELDWTFPHGNPNPESVSMLERLSQRVVAEKADVGFAFDGDGDRLGVVDDQGNELYSDKLGLLLARHLVKEHPGSRFVADVKSTGLFMDDPILSKSGSSVEYWITGHSHMKKRIADTSALAGFEKSGHFFFAPPIGKGYDDGLVSAVMVCEMLESEGSPLSEIRKGLRQTWQTPTLGLECSEAEKYEIVSRVQKRYEDLAKKSGRLIGSKIESLVVVNGVRVVLDEGTWGLVRASSNKPSLVVVAESRVSEQRLRDMFAEIDHTIRSVGKVGSYDQPFGVVA